MRKKASASNQTVTPDRQGSRRARAQTGGVDKDARHVSPRSGGADLQARPSTRSSPGRVSMATNPSPAKRQPQQASPPARRSFSNDQHGQPNGSARSWSNGLHTNLPPIPASPYTSEPSTPASRKAPLLGSPNGKSTPKDEKQQRNGGSSGAMTDTEDSLSRSRSKSGSYVPYKSPAPQSLNAAVEMFSLSEKRSMSDHGHPMVLQPGAAESKPRPSTSSSSSRSKEKRDVTQSPGKSLYSTHGAFWMTRSTSTPPTVNGKTISSPIPNEGVSDSLTYMVFLITLGRGFIRHESAQEPVDRQTYSCRGFAKSTLFHSSYHSNACIRVCISVFLPSQVG